MIRGVREGRGEGGREFSFLTAWWMKLSFSLFVLAWRLLSLLPDGSRLKKLCVGGGITCNAEGFAGETGVVNVLEGGRETPMLLSCSHYPLKGLCTVISFFQLKSLAFILTKTFCVFVPQSVALLNLERGYDLVTGGTGSREDFQVRTRSPHLSVL